MANATLQEGNIGVTYLRSIIIGTSTRHLQKFHMCGVERHEMAFIGNKMRSSATAQGVLLCLKISDHHLD
jgi:hypothetical protein